MNPTPEEPDQKIDQRYREVSAADAGVPPPRVRRAVLEEARAVQRKQMPAANDSRYLWRAVAGVAVLGIGVLLWRQIPYSGPSSAPTLPPAVVVPSAPRPEPTPVSPAESTAAETADSRSASRTDSPAPRPTARQEVSQEQEIDRRAESELAEAALSEPRAFPQTVADASAQAAPTVAAAAAPTGAASDIAKASSTAETQRSATSAGNRMRLERAADGTASNTAQSLLLQAFPQLWNSDITVRVWIVTDDQGKIVFKSGPTSLETTTNPELPPDLSISNWQTSSVRNQAGQNIVVMLTEQIGGRMP